jgi:hypothetical protein
MVINRVEEGAYTCKNYSPQSHRMSQATVLPNCPRRSLSARSMSRNSGGFCGYGRAGDAGPYRDALESRIAVQSKIQLSHVMPHTVGQIKALVHLARCLEDLVTCIRKAPLMQG